MSPGLALCALLAAARPALAQPGAAVRRLDAQRQAAREAIDQEYERRQDAMTSSEAWGLATDEERRQRLGALKEEFNDHKRRLEQQYRAAKTRTTAAQKGEP